MTESRTPPELPPKSITYSIGDDERPSEAVVAAVSDAAARRATEESTRSTETPPPLYYAIDPDALDSLFHATRRSDPTEGRVSFDYWNFEVSVYGGGSVEVRATSDE